LVLTALVVGLQLMLSGRQSAGSLVEATNKTDNGGEGNPEKAEVAVTGKKDAPGKEPDKQGEERPRQEGANKREKSPDRQEEIVQGPAKGQPPQAKEPERGAAPFDGVKAKQLQADWARYLGRSVEETLDLGGGLKMEMVLIPPGKYQMGSPEGEQERAKDEQQHEVEITKGFYLGKYEVAQEQYQAIMGQNPSYFQGKRLPVENVSWEQAVAFCGKLSSRTGRLVRLPTEAEWEYACRAGTRSPFHFGAELNATQANCDGNFPYGTQEKGPDKQQTCEVGSYAPNAWGLYDMHGNVWEWCADWYKDEYAVEDKKDPTGSSNGDARVLRGGSWYRSASGCRAAYRFRCAPASHLEYYGFRVAFRLD
jgi:formylglycine-generating enzyme required for sulfatase activity